jgi:DNA (cytosine-5)-methyltransferase 1
LDAVLHKGQTMPEKDRFPAVLQPVPILEAGSRTGPASNNKKAGMGIGEPGDPMFTLQAKAQHAIAVADPIPFNWMADGNQSTLGFDPTAKVAATLGANQHPAFVETLAFDTTQISSPYNYSNPKINDPCHPLAAGAHPPAVCITGDIAHTLTGEGFDASEDGTGRGTPIVTDLPYAFQPRIGRNGRGNMGALVNALQAQSGETGKGDAAPCVVDTQMAVRRLMPVEAERLQGFPDNWTLVPVEGGKDAADGNRYKQMGNSWPTEVIHWVGRRIDARVRELCAEVLTIGVEDYEWLTAP